MTDAVTKLLERYKNRFKVYPKMVQFDEGKEFYIVGVRELLKSKDITYYLINSERKAAIVERFNRTLKTMMWNTAREQTTGSMLSITLQQTITIPNTAAFS